MAVVWEALDPRSLEEIVATLVNIDHRSARRISPANGDQGIDIHLQLGDDRIEVWQVKAFTGRMGSSRRAQVKKSLATVVRHWGPHVVRWHLVAPIDPTLTELKWFKGVNDSVEFSCDWIDLSPLRLMLARNPEVAAYFNSSEPAEQKIRDLRTVTGVHQLTEPDAAPVRVDEAGELIAQVAEMANRNDPHFDVEFTTGRQRPSRSDLIRGDAVASFAEWDGKTSRVYRWNERFAGAAEQSGRIGIRELTVKAEDADLVDRFVRFGLPAHGVSVASIDIELPGMRRQFRDALMTIAKLPDLVRNVGLPLAGRMALTAADGVVQNLAVSVTDRTAGSEGVAVVGSDLAGVIRFEVAAEVDDGTVAGGIRLKPVSLDGRRPSEVLDSLRFMELVATAERLELLIELADRGEVPVGVVVSPGSGIEAELRLWSEMTALVESLVVLEPLVNGGVLVVPGSMTRTQAAKVRSSAQIVSGQVVEKVWTDGTLTVERSVVEEFGDGGQMLLSFATEEEVTVGDVTVPLGWIEREYRSVRIDGDPIDHADDSDVVTVRVVPGTFDVMTMRLGSGVEE